VNYPGQAVERDVERARESEERTEARVLLAVLQPADVCAKGLMLRNHV